MSTPGETLRAARESRNLSLKQVMQATRIRAHYLQAMEADDFSSLPSMAQARGFLRSYAAFLGLNAADLLAGLEAPSVKTPAQNPLLEAETPPQPVEDPAAEAEPAPGRRPHPSFSLNRLLGRGLPAAYREENNAAPANPTEGPSPSTQLLQDVGRSLRLRRELLSLSLLEIERHTHIRQANLQALEEGRLEDLPSPVQARGMLQGYASFLDMNLDEVMLRFAEALQLRRAERLALMARPRARKAAPWRWPRLLSPDLLFASALILTVLALAIFGGLRLAQASAAQQQAQAPSISDVLIEAAAPTPTQESQSGAGLEELPTPIVSGVEFPTPEEVTPTPLPGTVVQVTLLVSERTFLRVLVDGETVFDGRAAPGAAFSFEGDSSVEVLAGNGGAVQLLLNQLDQGRLSSAGQVAHFIYTLEGIATPTPLPSPTPSNTPRFQRTATPSVTPSQPPLLEP